MKRKRGSSKYCIQVAGLGLLASVIMTGVYITLKQDYAYQICNWLQEYNESIRTDCESRVHKMGKDEELWAFGLFWAISTGALIAWVPENE